MRSFVFGGMSKFFEGVFEFLSEPSGQKSSMRLMAVLTTLVVLIVWTYLSFVGGEMVSIPNNIVHILMILWGAKQIQRFLEGEEQKERNRSKEVEPKVKP